MHAPDPPATERRPELDALRALVVVGLIFFHSAMVFDTEGDFYVKNDATTNVTAAAGPVVVWAMPLMFVIAGVGAATSLRRRGAGGFAVERVRRLGVPLVFSAFALLPLPQWLRHRQDGSTESYLAYCRRFLDVHLSVSNLPFLVRGDEFESGHLWFVVLLLAFSLAVALLVALVTWRALGRSSAWSESTAAAVEARPVLLLVPALPLAAVCAVWGLEVEYGGWHRLAYLIFFAGGVVIATDPRFRTAMRRIAAPAAWLCLPLFLASTPGFFGTDEPFTAMEPLAIWARVCYGVTGWCAVVAILGLLDRPRPADRPAVSSRRSRLTAYLGDAVLPLYVLHQPIVVAVAYVVVAWELPAVAKFVVIVAVSLALTIAIYDLLVRRTPVTRFLFGMRPAA